MISVVAELSRRIKMTDKEKQKTIEEIMVNNKCVYCISYITHAKNNNCKGGLVNKQCKSFENMKQEISAYCEQEVNRKLEDTRARTLDILRGLEKRFDNISYRTGLTVLELKQKIFELEKEGK